MFASSDQLPQISCNVRLSDWLIAQPFTKWHSACAGDKQLLYLLTTGYLHWVGNSVPAMLHAAGGRSVSLGSIPTT